MGTLFLYWQQSSFGGVKLSNFNNILGEAASKLQLSDFDAQPGTQPDIDGSSSRNASLLKTDADNAADDLVRLVLKLIETLRQVMERQAIRRVESNSLTEDQIEHLGLTLMRLEERITELKEHFGMSNEDLTLHLGSLVSFLEDDHTK